MKTEPLQSLGPDRVVAPQQVWIQAPQSPAGVAAIAVPAFNAGPSAVGAIGIALGLIGVGPLTSVVTDADGCVWACGLPADAADAAAAGTSAEAAITAARRLTVIGASFRCTPPQRHRHRSVVRTDDARCPGWTCISDEYGWN